MFFFLFQEIFPNETNYLYLIFPGLPNEYAYYYFALSTYGITHGINECSTRAGRMYMKLRKNMLINIDCLRFFLQIIFPVIFPFETFRTKSSLNLSAFFSGFLLKFLIREIISPTFHRETSMRVV